MASVTAFLDRLIISTTRAFCSGVTRQQITALHCDATSMKLQKKEVSQWVEKPSSGCLFLPSFQLRRKAMDQRVAVYHYSESRTFLELVLFLRPGLRCGRPFQVLRLIAVQLRHVGADKRKHFVKLFESLGALAISTPYLNVTTETAGGTVFFSASRVLEFGIALENPFSLMLLFESALCKPVRENCVSGDSVRCFAAFALGA